MGSSWANLKFLQSCRRLTQRTCHCFASSQRKESSSVRGTIANAHLFPSSAWISDGTSDEADGAIGTSRPTRLIIGERVVGFLGVELLFGQQDGSVHQFAGLL